jgi:hypothetical protein
MLFRGTFVHFPSLGLLEILEDYLLGKLLVQLHMHNQLNTVLVTDQWSMTVVSSYIVPVLILKAHSKFLKILLFLQL